MNILIFGPNGSGKGTQSDLIKDKHSLEHIESGDIFRGYIQNQIELGQKAKVYLEKGELVPDEITIPMVLEALCNTKSDGWLLDGFPRNPTQAKKLLESLESTGEQIDFVIELILERPVAKNRIMGRRICVNSSHHPNNIFIPAIKPNGVSCRVCGAALKTRPDDQDETAIDERHDIYFDKESGTLAAVTFLIENCTAEHVTIGAERTIEEIRHELLSKIG